MAYGVSMHRFLRHLALAAGGALLLLAAAVGPSIAVDRWVTMFDSKYLPGAVTIRPGDTVTWVNDDDLPHDASGNGWSTPLLLKGDSHSILFARAGTYRYTCTIHPQMKSAVIVRAAGGSAPSSDIAAETATAPGGRSIVVALGLVTAVAVGFGLVVARPARPRA